MIYTTHLTDRSVLKVTGTDARDFLNGLVTADIEKLEDGARCHGGLLTPQGKIMFAFFILREGESYWVDVPHAARADLAKRLGFYKLRADVTIELADDRSVMAVWGGASDTAADPRLTEMGNRYIVAAPAANALSGEVKSATFADYEAHRIAHTVPDSIKDYPLGNTFPHDACFDQLNGVSFTKGCYVGQEVVSRMRHRGTARKRIVHVSADAELPATGTDVMAGDRTIGTLGSVDRTQAIAMIRLDRAAKAREAGTPITAYDIPVTLTVPSWADYEIASPTESSDT